MKSRLVAASTAVVMAITGALLIFTYVGNADDRAMADLDPVSVLIVKKAVPAGTPAESLTEFVASTTVPVSAMAPTALKDLTESSGKVTAVDLIPGEQLLSERLVAPDEIQSAGSVEVPKGLQEISFQLEPQRVVGGQIVPGDRVGIFISMADGGIADSPGETTQLVLHKTLVTAMQRAPLPVTEEGETNTQALPEGSMLITVAVDHRAAEKVVFAAEFATIWLSKESLDAKEGKPEVLQQEEVYR